MKDFKQIGSLSISALLLITLQPSKNDLLLRHPVAGSDPLAPALSYRVHTLARLDPVLLAPKSLHFNFQVPDNQISYITICSKESLIKPLFIEPLGKNNIWWWPVFLRKSYQFPCLYPSERKKIHIIEFMGRTMLATFLWEYLSKSFSIFV